MLNRNRFSPPGDMGRVDVSGDGSEKNDKSNRAPRSTTTTTLLSHLLKSIYFSSQHWCCTMLNAIISTTTLSPFCHPPEQKREHGLFSSSLIFNEEIIYVLDDFVTQSEPENQRLMGPMRRSTRLLLFHSARHHLTSASV